jgi:sigma-B regulation protein RsbU (phosphoserine phosphatase)
MIALGIPDAPAASQRTIQLRHGESVLMYTDGLTEAFSPSGETFGEHRLLETVAGPPPSAESIIAVIQSRLRDFVGSDERSDDLTMLAIRRR